MASVSNSLESNLPLTLVDYCKAKNLGFEVDNIRSISKMIPLQSGAMAEAVSSVVRIKEESIGVSFTVQLLDKNNKRMLEMTAVFKERVYLMAVVFDEAGRDYFSAPESELGYRSEDEMDEQTVLQQLKPMTAKKVVDFIEFVDEHHFDAAVLTEPVEDLTVPAAQQPEAEEPAPKLLAAPTIQESDDLGGLSCVII